MPQALDYTAYANQPVCSAAAAGNLTPERAMSCILQGLPNITTSQKWDLISLLTQETYCQNPNDSTTATNTDHNWTAASLPNAGSAGSL